MRKGKLGVVVCLYPILGFVCVILNQPLLCALIFGFVLVAERDEWAGRQTLQALGLSAITAVVVHVLHYIGSFFPSYYSGFFAFLSGAFSVLSMLVYLAAILISIVAIGLPRLRQAEAPAHARAVSPALWGAASLRAPLPAAGPALSSPAGALSTAAPGSPTAPAACAASKRPAAAWRPSTVTQLCEPFGSEPGRRVFSPLF